MIETTTKLERAAQPPARVLPQPLQALAEVSWNYWWSWVPDGIPVFRDLDPQLWEECEHSPCRLLAEVPEFRLMQMAVDPVYTARVARLAAAFAAYMNPDARTWASVAVPELSRERPVAYFCAEYGIHHSLPLYSGGLGILAGDHLKSASDLGLPLVAIGLLYQFGYFRQRLTRDGWQEEHYGELQPAETTLHPVRAADGALLTIELEMRGRLVQARVWRADVGRIPLYLLDTNLPENDVMDRWVTGHLYGGDRETRAVQEMMLGIGGIRLLRRLNVEPRVFHLNEGHSAFLTLELARELTTAGASFAEAARAVRERCVFTTHTPVAAGHDEFAAELVERCFGAGYINALGLTRAEFLNLGRVRAGDETELFGLTPLALRMCRSTNGVSRKHGEVSRALWQKMWPERQVADVPITHVTNGVHAPTWAAPPIRALYEKYAGPNWHEVLHDAAEWARRVREMKPAELWHAHHLLKQRLVAFIRHRTYQARLQHGKSAGYAEDARAMFDPEALTIGFARRVAGYKRWSLLLSDLERLLRLIANDARPVQFVFAGKAHPQDREAKLVLQQVARWKLEPAVMRRAVFLQDYDQEIARLLTQGVDVWLNVPRRPYEASGTSGQKVAMNGGLNFSVLDGWWIEGYDGTNGWAIGDLSVSDETPEDDARDAESLYRTLEQEIIPSYYERDDDNLPRRWIEMMKRCLETLAPAFNSDRMVQEYTRRIYLAETAKT